MTILYFSATGNSLYVAKSLGGTQLSIPQMIKENKFEFADDKIGIVFPVYEWSVNSYVANFLKKAKFNTDYLFAVSTYGMFSGAIAHHLCQLGRIGGYKFSYINKVRMVDNYLPGFIMKSQIANEPKKHIDEQIAIIKKDIDSSRKYIMPFSSFSKYATLFMIKRAENHNAKTSRKGIAKNVFVENTCIQCGVCTKVCPVNNIALDKSNGKIKFANKCFSCYACLHNCPQNSIHIKSERDRSRFRNQHVSLKEIIDSNE